MSGFREAVPAYEDVSLTKVSRFGGVKVRIGKRRDTKFPVIRSNGDIDYSQPSSLISDDEDLRRLLSVSDSNVLTKRIVEDIRRYLESGLSVEQTCDLVGISRATFARWRRKYPEFDSFVRRCVANAEYSALNEIREAGSGGLWQANAWFLERLFPLRYGIKTQARYHLQQQLHRFMSTVLDVLHEVDPKVKHEVVKRLKEKQALPDFGIEEES